MEKKKLGKRLQIDMHSFLSASDTYVVQNYPVNNVINVNGKFVLEEINELL